MLKALAKKICALTLHKFSGFMFTSYLDGSTVVLVATDEENPIRSVRISNLGWISTNIAVSTRSKDGNVNLIRRTIEHGYVLRYAIDGLEDDMLVHIAYKISLVITSIYMDVAGIPIDQIIRCVKENYHENLN